MLDNEPESGYRAGELPAAGPGESVIPEGTSAAGPAFQSSELGASPPVEGAQETGEPVAVTGAYGDGAQKTRRQRRRTHQVPEAVEQELGSAPPAEAGQESTASDVAEAGAEQAPLTKATRTRRRGKAAETTDSGTAPAESFGAATARLSPIPPVFGQIASAEPEDEARDLRRRAALTPPTVLFMAPEPEAVIARRRPAPEPAAPLPGEPEEPAEVSRRRRRVRPTAEPPDEEIAEEEEQAEAAEPLEEEGEEQAPRRRRRRGRRGRGRGKGAVEEIEEEFEEPVQAAIEETLEPEELEETEEPEPGEVEAAEGEVPVTRRRRRRRRRGAADVEVEVAEDGVETVVKIREPRRPVDEVQGVAGSTRLEAKRQRRRDGREHRRTRPHILSEAEFLARREAVDRVMVIRQRGDLTQVAVLEDGVLVEHYVSRADSSTMAGNVYLGKVQNVLPSMEAAFVDIGRGRNAVLYAGEVNWEATGLEGRARSIEQALKSGDSVLVQVTKDPIGHKGARLTSHIALSGRHLVYVPSGNASGISRKLPDNERKRLRDILKKLVPDGAGVIVRTAAEGATEDELARDIKRLQAQWEDIQAKAAQGSAPALLYQEPDLVIRVVRDLFNEDFRELVVQGDDAYDMVESYLSHVSPDLLPRLRRHVGVADVFAEKRIDEQILKALDRKVYLPSGGSLVIDRTEAMTVIDVNTGKYTGTGGNLEETVTRNNLEAAEEIVRQLRLRDIGGIIVIDFIDMVLESNRELVLRRLTECLGRDRTKHQVTEITSLGLVQMTRKRIGAGLLEAFSETCECCKGRGVIIHTDPLPDKHRSSTAEKVKAVASAAAASSSRGASGRKGRSRSEPAAPETAAAEVAASEAAAPEVVAAADNGGHSDTVNLSGEQPPVGVPDAPAVATRLANPDDPDAA
jgi:ribonuclease E